MALLGKANSKSNPLRLGKRNFNPGGNIPPNQRVTAFSDNPTSPYGRIANSGRLFGSVPHGSPTFREPTNPELKATQIWFDKEIGEDTDLLGWEVSYPVHGEPGIWRPRTKRRRKPNPDVQRVGSPTPSRLSIPEPKWADELLRRTPSPRMVKVKGRPTPCGVMIPLAQMDIDRAQANIVRLQRQASGQFSLLAPGTRFHRTEHLPLHPPILPDKPKLSPITLLVWTTNGPVSYTQLPPTS